MVYRIIHADIIDYLKDYKQKIIDGKELPYMVVLGDPPYALSFMGQKWDSYSPKEYQEWVTEWASLMLDCVYPGAVLAMYGAPKTYHRLTSGLEDAGWEIFESIVCWTYSSGFTKSYNVSKGIDKKLESETSASDLSEQWSKYGTSLKPSYEPIVLARAPRNGKTFADCALEYGTGAINIDDCRIASGDDYQNAGFGARYSENAMAYMGSHQTRPWVQDNIAHGEPVKISHPHPNGRIPANTILTHHPECDHDNGLCHPDCHARVIGEQSGTLKSGLLETHHKRNTERTMNIYGKYEGGVETPTYGDSGTAARFFYQAKPATWERHNGVDGKNPHVSIKSIEMNMYISRMLCPPTDKARILIPFSGSGSEIIACLLDGGWSEIVGVEKEQEFIDTSHQRIQWWSQFSSFDEAKKNRKKK